MRTIDHITMNAGPDVVFRVAADVENWPSILPHYRWVKVRREDGDSRVVEMNARRGIIPVKWTAIQTLDCENRRVYYRHIGGATRGMEVEWSVLPQGDQVRVLIMHDLTLKAPIVRSVLGRMVVDLFFIKHIAARTLKRMKEFVEAGGIADATRGDNGNRAGNSGRNR